MTWKGFQINGVIVMRITIYDVAKKAKVGIGTVSRVINNSPQIAPKTKEKVLKVIKELKYQPHAMAQSLARKKTNTIACIVPFFTGYFYVELLRGIQKETSNHGYDLILYSVDEIAKKQIFLKKVIQEKKVDGVLLISLDINEKEAAKFFQTNFPIVLIDTNYPQIDSITIENEQGAYTATKHLIDLGHKKITMITGNLNSNPAKTRLDGFQQALKDNNIEYTEKNIISVNSHAEEEIVSNHGFNKKAGYNAMLKLLQTETDRPTAIFASSDIQAIGAMNAATENELHIPNDIAIIGFDDIEFAEWIGLTTMRQPMFEMGQLAVSRLIKKLNNKQLPHFEKSFLPELIVRKSTAHLS